MKLQTLHDLFIHKIQALYDAESQIIESMPTIIDLASNVELKNNLKKHLEETIKQKGELEKLCSYLDIDVEGPSNLAMEGIIDNNLELLQDNTPSPILDAAIIAGSQAIEHYEISCYGTAVEWAELMQHTQAKQILGDILKEEKNTDKLLTQIATMINKQAMQMEGQIPMGRMG